MTLFDQTARTRDTFKGFNEPTFAFLNDVVGPFWQRQRDLLEEWFVTAGSDADVRSRFRSKREDQHLGAFWELYLHAMLKLCGCSVTPHPTLVGSTHHTDYLAQSASARFHLEATAAIVDDPKRGQVNKLVDQLNDDLQSLPSTEFFIHAEVISSGPSAPSARVIRNFVANWMSAFDPDWVEADLAAKNRLMHGPSTTWQQDGWQLVFRLDPIRKTARGTKLLRPFGALQTGIFKGNARRSVRRTLDDKAKHYPAQPEPIIVAVLTQPLFASHEVFRMVLFGEPGSRLSQAEKRKLGVDPFFESAEGRKVGAVIASWDLATWTIGKARPLIYLNPVNPVPRPILALLPFGVVNLGPTSEQDRLDPPGLDMAKFFGLVPDWPGKNDRLRD